MRRSLYCVSADKLSVNGTDVEKKFVELEEKVHRIMRILEIDDEKGKGKGKLPTYEETWEEV